MFEDVLINRVFWASVIVIVYRLLRWRMLVATHEYRVRVGSEAIEWASNSQVNENVRKLLGIMVNAMYKPMTPWFLVFALIATILSPRRPHKIVISEDEKVSEQILSVKIRLVWALISVSPLACTLGFLAVVLWVLARNSVNAVLETVSLAGDNSFQKHPRLGRFQLRH